MGWHLKMSAQSDTLARHGTTHMRRQVFYAQRMFVERTLFCTSFATTQYYALQLTSCNVLPIVSCCAGIDLGGEITYEAVRISRSHQTWCLNFNYYDKFEMETIGAVWAVLCTLPWHGTVYRFKCKYTRVRVMACFVHLLSLYKCTETIKTGICSAFRERLFTVYHTKLQATLRQQIVSIFGWRNARKYCTISPAMIIFFKSNRNGIDWIEMFYVIWNHSVVWSEWNGKMYETYLGMYTLSIGSLN